MDPMRAWEWQGEVTGTSLVTRKFSSSISCWKELHKLQEGESKNTKDKPWLLHVGASSKGISPTFYSHKGHYWRTTHDATVAAFTSVIMQILYTVPCERTIKGYTSRVFISEDISSAISVVYPIESFF